MKKETNVAEAPPERWWTVPGTICHVEIATPDVAKAADFCATLFGWSVHPNGEQCGFSTPGDRLFGCFRKGAARGAEPVLYVAVRDIPAALARAVGLGATTTCPKTAIAGGRGFYAQLRAPDGNAFGLWSES
jgi:predicted enzyme related to lactoylglutathione lyase